MAVQFRDSISSVDTSAMWTFVLAIAIAIGEQSVGATLVRSGFYPHHPVEEYYPAEQESYNPQEVPVGQKYFYEEPKHHHTDKLAEDYHRDEDLKKSVREQEQSALHTAQGAVDTIGKHGYDEGAVARKESAGGKIASEKSKEFGTSSKDGYGGHGRSGYKKGHKTTGFHKSYHNEESGKDYHYVDEDHKSFGENFGKSFDRLFGEAGSQGLSSAKSGADRKYSSSALRDSKYGHHGRKGSYNKQDIGEYDKQAYHSAGGHHLARYEPSY